MSLDSMVVPGDLSSIVYLVAELGFPRSILGGTGINPDWSVGTSVIGTGSGSKPLFESGLS